MPLLNEEHWIVPFIGALERVRKQEDRATLAKLRRGFTERSAERDLWVFSHLHGAAPNHEDAAMLIASLFATHPAPGDSGSLGEAFRKMRTEANSDGLNRRFANLLDSHRDDLPNRLRQGISLLKSNDRPVGWRQLLLDVLDWGKPARPVRRRWARDYWSGRFGGEDAPGAASDPTTTRPTTPEGDRT